MLDSFAIYTSLASVIVRRTFKVSLVTFVEKTVHLSKQSYKLPKSVADNSSVGDLGLFKTKNQGKSPICHTLPSISHPNS